METVIIKGPGFVEAPRSLARTAGHVLHLVLNRAATYFTPQRGWGNAGTTIRGHSVPYRVWLRHSALLEEINRKNNNQ